MQANSSELKRSLQGENSLATRIRWLLAQHGLQQKQLAEVMGVGVDRVKTLVLGRAVRLRAEEISRLEAAYGLPRAWLVDGTGPPPPGYVPPPPDGDGPKASGPTALLAAEDPPRWQAPPNSATDAQLLQQVVDATAAALAARGLQLPPHRRLRLYWGVYELSIDAGQVNRRAISTLIQAIEDPG
ncbi:helix-turn-helix domain-containing protein [Pseudaquabacterium pictum]|uniref:HTH cro/C1-type domain-containing protein n=1 Tax=Pseudaquabacterium pictum TaxID=2315236 RepID=A0A480AZT0_9BURK|nr:helix-turn-helix domain-containing protein [Rubrivivax pictus]GCL64328.1 hypothetical protein AQPW35_34090 [Rubrivivax pictus]